MLSVDPTMPTRNVGTSFMSTPKRKANAALNPNTNMIKYGNGKIHIRKLKHLHNATS